MKTLSDPDKLLSDGLAAIRAQFAVPASFPPAVMLAAEKAARRIPSEHTDRLDRHFVTLDPASSTDLDQAFAIEGSGKDWLLHYAIADVAWFVDDGDALDQEAWQRGTTRYLPDGRAGLYPPAISERAASLLPDGPRPAVVFTVRVASDGLVKLDGVERALIRSRAKLAYDQVTTGDLPPGFADLTARIKAAEAARGAARVDPPEQEVERGPDGRFALRFRPRLLSEEQNSALSLAANMAVADLLLAHGTGLFRVMPPPEPRAVERLRHTARAFSIDWPDAMPLDQFEQRLDPADARHSALMVAIRRAGSGASYAPWSVGLTPWHSALAATYAHATAPLRRLADRYVNRAALAIGCGEAVPLAVTEAFTQLPPVMATAAARDGQIERAVIDLAETALLAGQEGATFSAVITDVTERDARIQLCDLPVVARMEALGAMPGTGLNVRLVQADVAARKLVFASNP